MFISIINFGNYLGRGIITRWNVIPHGAIYSCSQPVFVSYFTLDRDFLSCGGTHYVPHYYYYS